MIDLKKEEKNPSEPDLPIEYTYISTLRVHNHSLFNLLSHNSFFLSSCMEESYNLSKDSDVYKDLISIYSFSFITNLKY